MTKCPLYNTHFVMCDGDHYALLIIHTETYKISWVNCTRVSPSITGPGNIKPECWTKAKKQLKHLIKKQFHTKKYTCGKLYVGKQIMNAVISCRVWQFTQKGQNSFEIYLLLRALSIIVDTIA